MPRDIDDVTEQLANAAYAMATLFVVIPLADLGFVLWPFHPANMAWRYGALAGTSERLMLPLLGLAIALAMAMARRRSVAVAVVAALAGVLVLTLFPALPLFLLDAVQMRRQVRPEAQSQYDRVTVFAAVKLLLFGGVAAVLLVAALRTWRAERRRSRRTQGAAPLVVSYGERTEHPS